MVLLYHLGIIFPLFSWGNYLRQALKGKHEKFGSPEIFISIGFGLQLAAIAYEIVLTSNADLLQELLLVSLAPLCSLAFLGVRFAKTPKISSQLGLVAPPFISILGLLGYILTEADTMNRYLGESGKHFLWIILAGHVILLLSAYFFFTLSFLVSLTFVIQDRVLKTKSLDLLRSLRLPSQSFLRKQLVPTLLTGFVLFTLGLLLGFLLSPENLLIRFEQFNARILLPMCLWAIFAWISLRAVALHFSGISAMRQTLVTYLLSLPVMGYELYILSGIHK